MPSPIDVLLDPVSLTAFAIYALLILWERLAPARPLPRAKAWALRGLVAFVAYFAVSSYLPLFWTEYLQPFQLFDLSGLGTLAGAAIGLLVYECCGYFYHRSMHASNVLWRGLHQMHHSAERVDIWGALLFHPFDVAAFAALTSVVYSLVLGLAPAAAALAGLYGLFASFFQHANIRTPRWLGYVIQRPEAHGVHHQRGVHGYNYSDLPLWDIVFGTFRNPAVWREQSGFYEGGSKRIGAMLLGRDISTPESNPMSARPALSDLERAAA
jgi:sterol desaturase/sphingolipid hydroxylase (fatty acid hydroxylase superfamily)